MFLLVGLIKAAIIVKAALGISVEIPQRSVIYKGRYFIGCLANQRLGVEVYDNPLIGNNLICNKRMRFGSLHYENISEFERIQLPCIHLKDFAYGRKWR